MNELRKPIDGKPKLDVEVTISITRKVSLKSFRLGKRFIKKLLESIRLKL